MQTEKFNYHELAGEDPPQKSAPSNGVADTNTDAGQAGTPAPAPAAEAPTPEIAGEPDAATEQKAEPSVASASPSTPADEPEKATEPRTTGAKAKEEHTTDANADTAPSSGTNGTTKVPNIALVNAVTNVVPGVADIMQRAREQDYKGSPAERRKAVYADMERLRTHAIYLRDSAEEQRSGETADEAEAKRLVEQAKQCEQVLSVLSAVYDALLSRAERRAGRDGNLKALERDPLTKKAWKEAYRYDPRRPEMKELYKEKTHPAHVFADGAKLIRNDGGKYGLVGSHLLVIHQAEQRAGETIPEKLRVELLKGFAYDALERGHGMGAGYNRDAAWILHLWSSETKTPLRIDDLPVRHPIKSFEDWAETEFPQEHEKGLQRVGAPATETDAENGEVT